MHSFILLIITIIGRPFIIASHSQGTLHAKRLISEFIDGKKIQKKLIAAYLVGWKVDPDEFDNLKPMSSPNEIGGFVAWNTYKINKYPRKNTYEEYFRGGVTSNPITWDKSTETDKSLHKGLLYSNLKIFPRSLSIKVIDGMIWSTVPNLPGKLFFSTIKDYHFADINLFWVDIQKNAKLRVKEWFKKIDNILIFIKFIFKLNTMASSNKSRRKFIKNSALASSLFIVPRHVLVAQAIPRQVIGLI
ncbi:MAG: hypothetical protein CM15mP102_17540 [Flavobacteriales bacterium]|nr:MAG: hypothetical protein CM15mP102_17540 [Flavobacteriales bacterium]